MNANTEILRGELERLFELDELKSLSADLLGLDPEQVGGAEGKGTFARALLEKCEAEHAVLALADAVILSKDGVNEKVRKLFELDPGEELKAGAQVGSFRVQKKIGEGGVGVVYLGERSSDGGSSVRAAIKVLRPAHARDRVASRRFLTVARVHMGIRDTGPGEGSLGSVLEVGTLADGRPWVATELVDGQLVAARIGRTGPMHYNEARPILRGVLRALERLHARGLVHGDVKAENVFVVRPSSTDKAAADRMTNEPTGVLVDAGIDRLFSRSPAPMGNSGLLPVFGTPKAIAPEVARGGVATPASDLYAVGCLLYEVLTGRAPFVGESAIDVVAQHLVSEPEPPSAHAPRGWVPRELDQIVLRALAKTPKDRYPTATSFREVLESIGRASIPPAARTKEDLDEDSFKLAADELRENPSDVERAVSLERIVEPAQAWDKAVEVFREVADKAEEAEVKKALLYRIARLQESDLEDRAGAEAAYRAILELDSSEEIARAGIEELKRASGDAEGLVELLLEKAEREESSQERAAILREIAETYERSLGDADNAFVAWTQALSEDPRDERIIGELERLAEGDLARWNEVVTSLNESLQASEDDAAKIAMLVLLGRWYADKLGRPDFAVPCFGQALTLDPANEAALDGTIALYRKAQSWQELVTLLIQRADTTPIPTRARDLRAEAADIVFRKMGDAERAAEVFEQILKDDAAHPKASEALEVIYADSQQWKKLVELLEAKAKGQRGEARVETLSAIAEIYEDRLDDLDRAASLYESVLQQSSHNVPALKGLERIYARGGKFTELLGNLETQLEIAATPRQKNGLLERIGQLQLEEFVDHEKAAQAFARIVEVDPGHEAANTALARVYRHLQRFDEVAKTLERHALGVEDEDRKISLLLQSAKVLMVDVGAPERAVAMVERVTALRPEHTEALELLSRLQAQAGDAHKALEATERLAETEKDAEKRAELYVRAGRILEDRGDKDGAIARYKRALDAQPDHGRAAAALRSIYASRGDAHGAAELLLREIEMAPGSSSKARLYADLGELRRDRLGDERKAVEAFERALELDGTCTPAARGLGDIAYAKGDYATAARFYEPLLARVGEMTPELAREVSVRCGDALRRLGELGKAQRAYLNAKAFAKGDREVLERVAEVTFEGGAAAEAAELYREIVEEFGSALAGSERGRVLWRLGEALRRADELGEAEKVLVEAADLTHGDADTLKSLRQLYASKNDWEKVVRTMRRRIEVAEDDERFELLVETGDVLMQKIGDRAAAAKSYVAALEVRADDRNLLTRLMGVYSESKDWSRLVEVILRIAELVDDPKQLSKYYITAAGISYHELHRYEEAADYYEQALDHDPGLQKGFDGLVKALSAQSDWERLEEALRARLKRLGDAADPKDLAALWDQLGELLTSKLERKGDGTEALEQAQKLEPGNRRRAEQLAEAYAAEPKRFFQKAVRVHSDLLRLNPYRIESYQALRKLYTEVKRPDESWCVCQALTVLKNAEPDEESFFKKHRTREPAGATEVMTAETFGKLVMHVDQDPLLTDIFATITPAVLATRSRPLASFGLDERDKRNAEQDEADMARMLHYAAGVLGTKLPSVYYAKDDGGLSFVFANPPAVGLGQGARAGGPAQALAFVAGRHLSYYRPGHFLRMLVPTGSGLRAWLLAAIKSSVGQFPVPKELATSVDESLAAFRTHLSSPQQETLRSLVQRLLSAAPELDLKKWVAHVDLTADRVGFILANDLEISAALVRASPEDAASVPQKERLKELHLYSVSEEYLALRQRLGLSIGG
jgi:tetratricopeptide (TPR) repeat protein